jgi:hypothetical protein
MAYNVIKALHHNPNIYEVGLGELKISAQSLRTVGVGPCIAVAGVIESVGFLGHFSDVSRPGEFQGRFSAALETVRILGASSVYLIGAGPEIQTGAVEIEADRQFAAEAAANAIGHGSEELVTRWTEPGFMVDVVVRPQSSVPS